MKTITTTSQSKPRRTVRLESAGRFSVTETKAGKTERVAYLFLRIPSDTPGTAGFTLRKIESQTDEKGLVTAFRTTASYNVQLAGPRSSCDCKWGVYGANKKLCRHAAGLLALVAQGKLSV